MYVCIYGLRGDYLSNYPSCLAAKSNEVQHFNGLRVSIAQNWKEIKWNTSEILFTLELAPNESPSQHTPWIHRSKWPTEIWAHMRSTGIGRLARARYSMRSLNGLPPFSRSFPQMCGDSSSASLLLSIA